MALIGPGGRPVTSTPAQSAAQSGSASPHIKDSGLATFAADVLEASKGGKPLGTAAGIRKAKAAYKRIKLKCDYYNPEIHAAAFALPNWIRKLVP